MIKQDTLARYLEPLLRGDRKACRAAIEETLQSGVPANSVYIHIVWPVMVEIEKLLRADRITPAQEHLATRVNRTIVDQLQNKLPRRPGMNKKVVVCCAPDELQELGAQMMTDLFESDGWDVRFLGGGLTNDDILAFINE
jgi:methanogenic corrinoid protein MtbC1